MALFFTLLIAVVAAVFYGWGRWRTLMEWRADESRAAILAPEDEPPLSAGFTEDPPPPGPAPTPVDPPPATPTPTPVENPVIRPPSQRTQLSQTLLTCFPALPANSALREAKDLPSLLTALEKEGLLRDEREIENFHLRLPGGVQRRLQLIFLEEAGRPSRIEMRLFGVDAEGLPVPMDLPPGESLNPPRGTVERYLSQGQIEFHQVRRHLILNNGTSVMADVVNGLPRELMIRAGTRTLACTTLSCRCLQGP